MAPGPRRLPLIPMAKICRPATGPALFRERLFCKLDAVRIFPMIWVSGPAGSGKTTLISTYVEARGLPCLWYQVDSGDTDLASFFHYLGLAGCAASPGRRKKFPVLTPEYGLGLAQFSRNFFQELGAVLPMGAVVVLDNLQEVPEQAPLHLALLEGLSRLPAGANLVLISREEPPICFSGRAELAKLGWMDLRLTIEECNEILHMSGIQISRTHALYARTDGWAAGLRLFLEASRNATPGPEEMEISTPVQIMEYFGGQIFDRQSEVVRGFLLKTSLLPVVTPEAARILTGYEGAEDLLAELHRSNTFTHRRELSQPTYQYHPLFREFLSRRAEQSFSKDFLASTQRKAAEILLKTGQDEDAAELMVKCRAWDILAQLLLARAPVMLQQGRNQTLLGWLKAMPQEVLESSPWLLFWLGTCLFPLDPGGARPQFELAYRRFLDADDPLGAYSALAEAVHTFFFECARFQPLDQWIEEYSRLSSRYPIELPDELEARLSAAMLHAFMYRRPRAVDLDHWAARLKAALLRTYDPERRVALGPYLLYYCLWKGDIATGAWAMETMRASAEAASQPLGRILWAVLSSAYAMLASQPQNTVEDAERGLRIAASSGVHVLDFILLQNCIYAHLFSGQTEEAASLLHRMEAHLEPRRLADLQAFHISQGWYALSRGLMETALEQTRRSLDVTIEAGLTYFEPFDHLTLGFILVELGRLEEAEAHLEHVRGSSKWMASHLIDYTLLVLEARLADARGEPAHFANAISSAMALGRERELTCWFFWHRKSAARIMRLALEAGIEEEQVQRVIRTWKLEQDVPPHKAEKWPWPLRIQSLGGLHVSVHGKPVGGTKKGQRKPTALLEAMVAFGEKGVTEALVSDDLWPESDGAAAHDAFAVTVHRLRRMLGQAADYSPGKAPVVQMREGRLFLDPKQCWVDAWAFERLLNEAEPMWREAPQEAARITRKALALYRGPFLPQSLDAPWTVQTREKLRSLFLRAAETLGLHLEKLEAWAEALEVYQRVLEVEPLLEEVHRRVLICLTRLGRKAEAMAAYDRFRNLIEKSLGVDPSPEIESLRKSLLCF